MADQSKIWVSELNARPEIRGDFPRSTVHFYDTTLRDGEQTVGVILSPQQKLEIARKLDELGVSRIEAGFPRVSPEDAEAIQLMSKANLKSELWGFSRALKGDVEELLRLGLCESDLLRDERDGPHGDDARAGRDAGVAIQPARHVDRQHLHA